VNSGVYIQVLPVLLGYGVWSGLILLMETLTINGTFALNAMTPDATK
jgi:hypothetical protein